MLMENAEIEVREGSPAGPFLYSMTVMIEGMG